MRAAARRDYEGLAACFTEDAVVQDEQRTHRGRSAIAEWQRETRRRWRYTLTVRGGHQVSARRYRVKAHLHGNFPGGDADVEYLFTTARGLISRLVIG